jgi:DNA-binding transcriptional regulator YiaG
VKQWNFSQTELAEILGVRQATVSGWETGKRSIGHPIDLAMMEVERQQKENNGKHNS